MNADPRHVLGAGDIPVVRIDRGGQVTYHGRGSSVYPLTTCGVPSPGCATGHGARGAVALCQ
jgi:hypothetical protein